MSTFNRARGPIAWMAANPVAANLALFLIVVGGLLGVTRTRQEVFPELSPDMVNITVPYPGASPEEVEQGIVLAIEEEVRGLDGVKRVTSNAAEGLGTVSLELLQGADKQGVLSDAKTAVDRISSFPDDAEEPTVALASGRRESLSLVIAGDTELEVLHAVAERARERLIDHADITQAELAGVPPLEVEIGISRAQLDAYGLTLEQVAAQVAAASLELPGGAVRTERGDILVRLSDRAHTAEDFRGLVLRGTGDGALLRLGDVATVRDGYEDADIESYYNGQRAVRVIVYRVGDETPIALSQAAAEVAEAMRAELPPQITITPWNDSSEAFVGRMQLLLSNGWQSLVLVLIVLALFLELRLALWVAFGIPSSFLAAFWVLPAADQSINMVSMFAFIVTLGIVVDDAIVVGEDFWHRVQAGKDKLTAALEAAQAMFVPVTFSVLTTVAAFSPLLFIPGFSGRIFRMIPIVVISVVVFSLVECFLVLPSHLGHGGGGRVITWLSGAVAPVRERVSAALERVVEGPYQRLLRGLIAWRYATLAGALALFLWTVGLLAGGWVPFTFFPNLEGDVVAASVRLPYGAPVEQTRAVAAVLQESAARTVAELGGDTILRGVFTRVGQGSALGMGAVPEQGSHLLSVEVNLVPGDERELSAEEFRNRWAANTPPLVGIESMRISASLGGGAGAAVDVQLSHSDLDVLARASAELAAELTAYSDLTDIENTYANGKPQLDLHLLPAARTLGLTGSDVARQVRSAFFGAEALREQRGRNEVKVMVRLPEEQRRSEDDLTQLRVRTAAGGTVPLGQVARVERDQAPTSIRREDGRRLVSVSGELAAGARSPQKVQAAVVEELLPALTAKYPGLSAAQAGQRREQAESFAALGQNFLVALFAIYALLAVPFRSYTQPLIIMTSIPMGLVGAVGGHVLNGYGLSMISVFGIIALSGVVVNDSLVLIDAANTFRAEGQSPVDAVVSSGQRRMRPILLTSLTTFFGLMPLTLEQSVQARFLIPMALSLGYGVLFTTFVALLLIPALYLVVEDAHGAWARLGARLRGAGAVEPQAEA